MTSFHWSSSLASMEFSMRFFEYMDVGNANNWISERIVSKKEILEKIAAHYPIKLAGRNNVTAPSVDYESPTGSVKLE